LRSELGIAQRLLRACQRGLRSGLLFAGAAQRQLTALNRLYPKEAVGG
jgi:hypothetical protein